MWKPFLLTIGIYLCILGGECLILEKAIMARESPAIQQQDIGIFRTQPVMQKNELVPSEWAPWSFLSVGAMVILYGLTLSRQ